MSELMVDFITSLDGYASAEGWPGFWGMEGPEYLAWLDEQPEVTHLMGANTYRLMSSFYTSDMSRREVEEESLDGLTRAPKVVFSSTLEEPLGWANTTLVRADPVETVKTMKAEGSGLLSTLGSLTLARTLLQAGLVDRYRVGVFPIITGKTGANRVYDGYPDIALEMTSSQTFDGRILMLEYKPTLIDGPPGPAGPS